MIFSKSDWKSFDQGIEREWLLTNGLGSFASSTIIGANTRRYHGLLIASLKSPGDRHLIISKFNEEVLVNNKTYDLSTYQTPGYLRDGYKFLNSINVDSIVNYSYKVEDIFIEKKITLVNGKNTVAVVYIIKNGSNPMNFKIQPLINFRDFHGNTYSNSINFEKENIEKGIVLKPNYSDIKIRLEASEGTFHECENTWFYNMEYFREKERGLNSVEDHFIPGYFEFFLASNEIKVITLIGSIDEIDTLNGLDLLEKEQKRVEGVIEKAGYNDEFINRMVAAADKFIVKRDSTNSKTIIAGYHWFSDWGRDTMIALPGLTLINKRYDDAKSILLSFFKYIENGLIPNMFPDVGQKPIYNSVDGSLWLFEAVFKYLQYTNEYNFVKENFYNKLKEIIEYYKNGTLFNIKMDNDGLIQAGDEFYQLTWMDAKVGDWVVTPRSGKTVEVNALWYNALKIMNYLAEEFEDTSEYYDKLAETTKKSFEKFWNEDSDCLYDVINNDVKDDSIRPNQILTLSLSYPIMEIERGKSIVRKVFNELYVTFGLRSLSKASKNYTGIYKGDQFSRDSSYHQGTAWAWLIGHFITAYIRVNDYSEESKAFCKKLLEAFNSHLSDAGVDNISEIFDGDEPNIPRGCIAQAWSVAEILRAYVEDILGNP